MLSILRYVLKLIEIGLEVFIFGVFLNCKLYFKICLFFFCFLIILKKYLVVKLKVIKYGVLYLLFVSIFKWEYMFVFIL